ncbi:MAG: hypothetical protein ACI4OI_00130, partial [Gemmiger sp.]
AGPALRPEMSAAGDEFQNLLFRQSAERSRPFPTKRSGGFSRGLTAAFMELLFCAGELSGTLTADAV